MVLKQPTKPCVCIYHREGLATTWAAKGTDRVKASEAKRILQGYKVACKAEAKRILQVYRVACKAEAKRIEAKRILQGYTVAP